MKKVLLFWTLMLIGVTTAHAQFFIGGNFGVDKTGGKTLSYHTSVDKGSSFLLQINPKVGYYFNDNFAVGISSGILKTSQSFPGHIWGGGNYETSTSAWTTEAFTRYNVIGIERLSMYLEAGIGFALLDTKVTENNFVFTDIRNYMITVGVLPVLSYDLGKKIHIEASSDFLRLGFTTLFDKGNTSNMYHFGMGVNAIPLDLEGNLQTASCTIGLILKF